MERETIIRFRGIPVRGDGKWVEGSLIVDDLGEFGTNYWIKPFTRANRIEIIPGTKSQYTGYNFKNRKLFDGDVLQFKDTQSFRYVCWYQGKWVVASQKDCKGDNMDLHAFCQYQAKDSNFNFVGTIWDATLE